MKNNSQTQIKFYWIYLIGIFLILTLPLLSFPPTFHPPAWSKSVIFRIIFSILLFIFISQVLYKKYVGSGLSSYDASARLDEFKSYLKDLKLKLERQKKSEQEINKRFKEEFEKLCQRLDR